MFYRHHEGPGSADSNTETAGKWSYSSWTSTEAEFEVSGLEGGCPNLGWNNHRYGTSKPITVEAVSSSEERHTADVCVPTEFPNKLSSAAASTVPKPYSQFKNWRDYPFLNYFVGTGAPSERDPECCQTANLVCQSDRPAGSTCDDTSKEGSTSDDTSQDSSTSDDEDGPKALLCCRIHPLIRDSASVKAVPFYVEWWRDYSRNGYQTFPAVLGLAIVVFLFISSYPIELNTEKVYVASKNGWKYPWVELTLTSLFFARCLWEPFCAVGYWASYTVFKWKKYQGALSWKDLDPQNRREVRTTMVALLPIHDLEIPKLWDFTKERHKYLASLSKREEKMQRKPLPYFSNRECGYGHWDKCPSVGISCPMHSSVPRADEATEQFSINEVEHTDKNGIREAYKDYLHSGNLRLALERLLDKKEDMKKWLLKWQNCWPEDELGDFSGFLKPLNFNKCRKCKCRMRCMLEAWSKPPSSWGPSLDHLELRITAINEDGLGVLLVPQCLLSSLLPRYGHKSSIDEIAYMSAKAVKGDQRYYRPRVVYFWLITAIVMRFCLFVTVHFDNDILIVASVTVFGLWVQFAKGAFHLDITAMVRGRVLKGCVLKSAWGVRKWSDVAIPSEVTANLLAKWNSNVAVESHALLNSFHTERWSDNERVHPMDLDTFQKAGGLLIGGRSAKFTRREIGLAIIPGRKDLRIRTQYRQDQVYELGYSELHNMQFRARDIISHSPCPVGGFLDDDDSTSESSKEDKHPEPSNAASIE